MNTTVYLINRSHSVPLNEDLPKKMWSDKHVSLSHLKIFDCLLYVQVNARSKTKLDLKYAKRHSLDTTHMNSSINYGMIRIKKKLGATMSYSVRRQCTRKEKKNS